MQLILAVLFHLVMQLVVQTLATIMVFVAVAEEVHAVLEKLVAVLSAAIVDIIALEVLALQVLDRSLLESSFQLDLLSSLLSSLLHAETEEIELLDKELLRWFDRKLLQPLLQQ